MFELELGLDVKDRLCEVVGLLDAELLIWLVFLDDIELEDKLGREEREGVDLVTLLLELGGVADLLGAELLIWLVLLDDIVLEEKLGREEREGTDLLEVTDLLDVLGAL
jgi:hypothetical protein